MARYEKGEFLTVPNKTLALSLRGASLNVYLSICGYADGKGQCFPSYDTIAKDTGYSRRACIAAVEELVGSGFLSVEPRQRKNGSASSNVYQLMIFERVVNHSSLGSEPQFTPITKPYNTIDKSIVSEAKASQHQKEKELLSLVNRVIGREFRTLPERGVSKTLKAFSLVEIETALTALAADDWHQDKLKEFKIDYLIRSTTIDKFLAIGKPKRDPRVYG